MTEQRSQVESRGQWRPGVLRVSDRKGNWEQYHCFIHASQSCINFPLVKHRHRAELWGVKFKACLSKWTQGSPANHFSSERCVQRGCAKGSWVGASLGSGTVCLINLRLIWAIKNKFWKKENPLTVSSERMGCDGKNFSIFPHYNGHRPWPHSLISIVATHTKQLSWWLPKSYQTSIQKLSNFIKGLLYVLLCVCVWISVSVTCVEAEEGVRSSEMVCQVVMSHPLWYWDWNQALWDRTKYSFRF